jgi:hypothetical protein
VKQKASNTPEQSYRIDVGAQHEQCKGEIIMSGTGNPTFLVAASGDQGIDGLIDNRAWSGGSITYSFSVSSAAYSYAGTGLTDLPANFNTISAAQEAAAHFALNADVGPSADAGFSVEGFTNLTITSLGNTNTGNAEIRFGETSSAIVGTARVADFPGGTETGPVDDNGDVWFGTGYNYRSPQAGNYSWHTMLHETGHALGLKHGQATYNFGALPANLDAMEFTVMTYRSYVGGPTSGYTNETWGYAQTYMMADIATLQYMYGADYTTNSGNTVYSWNPGSGNTLVNGAIAINPGGNRILGWRRHRHLRPFRLHDQPADRSQCGRALAVQHSAASQSGRQQFRQRQHLQCPALPGKHCVSDRERHRRRGRRHAQWQPGRKRFDRQWRQ